MNSNLMEFDFNMCLIHFNLFKCLLVVCLFPAYLFLMVDVI